MAYKVFMIYENGTVEETEQPKAPDYKQLNAAVRGLIQTVPYFTKFRGMRGTAYANEEGILLGMPDNWPASKAWRENFAQATPLYGPVIFYAKVPKAK